MPPYLCLSPAPDTPQCHLQQNIAPLGEQMIPEFLYQLTQMLLKENTDVIEWSNGRIVVHDPPKVAKDILGKYYRHSNYSSFQRQLNYFGFRKICTKGKGKLAPCTYINLAVKNFESLLYIKRKTSKSRSQIVPKKRKAEYNDSEKTQMSSKVCRTYYNNTTAMTLPQPEKALSSNTSEISPFTIGINDQPDSVLSGNIYHRIPFSECARVGSPSLIDNRVKHGNAVNKKSFIPEKNTEEELIDDEAYDAFIDKLFDEEKVCDVVKSCPFNKPMHQYTCPKNEIDSHFDADRFRASLNEIIKTTSSFQPEVGFWSGQKKSDFFPNSNILEESAYDSEKNNGMINFGNSKRLRDDGLVISGIEPTPLREMKIPIQEL